MKRFVAFSVTLILLVSCFMLPASAATGSGEAVDPNASSFIVLYSATLSRNSSSGQLAVNFSITAKTTATKLGIETLKFEKSDGSTAATFTGTLLNGLLQTNNTVHVGDYYYNGCATSCRAVVTLFVEVNGVREYRVVTTDYA